MSATSRGFHGDAARGGASPAPHAREHAKDTLCRNVTIYGRCRYEDKGCIFNHDPMKLQSAPTHVESVKKRLNVDSPAFTPSALHANGTNKQFRPRTMSPKVVNAAPFTPKKLNPGTTNAFVLPDTTTTSAWATPDAQEFVPQAYNGMDMGDGSVTNPGANLFDGYVTAGAMGDVGPGNGQPQVNPYAQDTTGLTGAGASFYQGQGGFMQPLQYHLYAPLGPHRENLLPYQRTVHDLFIPDALREELQRKAEASLQVLPSKFEHYINVGNLLMQLDSSLPAQLDHFHSLVPLDTTNQKNATVFGYPSWVYKAVSGKDGKIYALRRLEGYRLTNEKSIRSVQTWKRVDNGNVITIHDAFTTSAFGDRSLIFVTDYHPLSKTLAEHYFGPGSRFSGRISGTHIPEQVLWGYIVQIASALKTIHGMGLAARLIDLSKVLLTSKGRIRLNGCAVLDVVKHDATLSISDLQHEDLLQFGRLMLSLASNNPAAANYMPKSMDFLSRSYSTDLKECILWLLTPPTSSTTVGGGGPTSSSSPISPSFSESSSTTNGNNKKTIDQFLRGISGQITSSFNSALHLDDQLHSELMRELENGRLFRLMAKLGFINERPEFDHDRQWSETGDRYLLKLFRDYVFHQVDSQNTPVVDLGHVVACLNKLDAGVDEKILLVSRDEQNCLLVSYRELKRGVEGAFQDLIRAGSRGGGNTGVGGGSAGGGGAGGQTVVGGPGPGGVGGGVTTGVGVGTGSAGLHHHHQHHPGGHGPAATGGHPYMHHHHP
ncbi:MAG: hypothetical protein M1823_002179 [Watsoniomyces obsoletus]|nr:MAG: hypothetical protein M1823_002179 [Watsoniomyces obsoletus]